MLNFRQGENLHGARKIILENVRLMFLATIFSLGLGIAFAWTDPASAPPTGNTPTPVNLGSVHQIKTGGFWAGSLGVTNGLVVESGNVGIGTISPAYKLDVAGAVSADSLLLKGSSGIKFPDGTIQTTAPSVGSQPTGGIKIFTSDNGYSQTFGVPNGVTMVKVEVYGAGGGGGNREPIPNYGGAGGTSCFGSVCATGGSGGGNGVAGNGGTGSGGDLNLIGGDGNSGGIAGYGGTLTGSTVTGKGIIFSTFCGASGKLFGGGGIAVSPGIAGGGGGVAIKSVLVSGGQTISISIGKGGNGDGGWPGSVYPPGSKGADGGVVVSW
jgi:hypothetical protein